MKIVSFTQGDEDWHAWRKGGLGASDISIVSGSNPYKTPLQLWEIKCGYRADDPMNRAMQHGVDNEQQARDWVNGQFRLHLQPTCVEDQDVSYFRASLDGYDFDQKVLCEIKCPISEAILDKALMTQAVPDYWFDQMQWQIMLAQPQRAFLAIWDWRTKSCITLDMFGHPNKIKKLRELGEKFWKDVQFGRPPEPQESDYIEVKADGLHEMLIEYCNLGDAERGIQARRKEIKTKIEAHGDDGNFIAYGYKVQRIASTPRYDHDQMKVDGIDLDKYLKKTDSIGYYRIFPPKGKR